MRAVGIDFGTCTTVAMLRSADGRTRPVLFDGSPLLPSAVHLAADGAALVGRDAQRAARVEPAGFEPAPKRRVDDPTVLLNGQVLAVPALIAAVLSRVAAEARPHLRPGVQVRLTHPARPGGRSWPTPPTGPGCPRRGWSPSRSLAVYDLGGATFEATVPRRTPAGFDVLAADGVAVGGSDFDHAVVEHLRRRYAAADERWQRLLAPADDAGRRLRALLYDDVRAAKESLSRTARAELHVPVLDVRAQLTRDELDGLIRPYLARTVECLARTVAVAGLSPGDLAAVFLVGGSSRIPLAARLIQARLGVTPATLDQPETVVAEGALYLDPPAPRRPGGTHSGLPRVAAAAPAPAPAAASPPAVAPDPAGQPDPPAPAAAVRPWYAEPVILATLLMLVLVVVAAAVLVTIV